MILKENKEKIVLIKSRQSAILSELLELDANYAESYIKWMHNLLRKNIEYIKESNLRKKLKIIRKDTEEYNEIKLKIKKCAHRSHPLNMSKGDIVHIKFGVNLGDELCDLDKEQKSLSGHYGMILAQTGFIFTVIPLTSQSQPSLDLVFELNNVNGLPKRSYLLFSQIRSVNIRRIERIISIPSGKITLNKDVVKEIDKQLANFYHIKILRDDLSW